MKRKLLPLATLFLFGAAAHAQVGIGTLNPNASTQLEVVSTNKGVLIPQVSLTGTTDATTIKPANVNSLLVFNTTDNAEIKSGYYYWFKNEWIRLVSSDQIGSLKNTVNVSLIIENDELVLTDSDGNKVRTALDLKDIVTLNETVTTITKNADGSYTYKNEKGDDVIIDIVASVIQNFEDIINETTVQNIFKEYLTQVEGNVTFDGDNFIYYDENGIEQTINITEMVRGNETLTNLVKVSEGKYTYYNEASYDKDGNLLPNATGITIDVITDITNNFEEIINEESIKNIFNEYISKLEGNVIYDGDNFIYYDENGIEQTINITEMVRGNETLTNLVKVSEGKYTYYNEASYDKDGNLLPNATGITIDVITDITNNFEEIINEESIKNIFNEYISKLEGNVIYDGDNFIYYDENGIEQTINITEMVRGNETLTNLVKVSEGKYTYYNEASYDKDGNLLPNATGITIDVITDITNNFEDIINEETIKNIFKEYFKTIEGNVTYDGTNFYYTNSNGVSETINIEEMVKNHETLTSLVDVVTQEKDENGILVDVHTLTYTDEKGNANPIDLKILVKGSETITEMSYDAVTHKLSYKNETGEVVDFNLVDLVGDVQTLTKLELNIDTKKLEYTDENETKHILDLAHIVQEPWYSVATNIGAISNTDNIYTLGWVGIGFTEPSAVPNEKLRVDGTITTVSSHYADYVFEDYFDGFSPLKNDYKFKDLETIADFIETNRHLPGITPIGDLTQTNVGYSFNMSELSIQLLEKTEELYLHLIDQKRMADEKNRQLVEKTDDLYSHINDQKAIIDQKNIQIERLENNNQEIMERLNRLERLLNK